jgi:hypothetical protein
MSQVVEHLPSKHEALNSNSCTTKKKKRRRRKEVPHSLRPAFIPSQDSDFVT